MTVPEQIERIAAGIKRAHSLSVADEVMVMRRVQMAVTRILSSCNRDDLPEELEIVAAQMAEDMLRDDTVIETPQQVSSVTRGDTSISYRDKTSNAKTTRDYLQDYEDNMTVQPFTCAQLWLRKRDISQLICDWHD